MRPLLPLFLMTAPLWAQAPAPDPAVALEGKVVDSATKQPVAGARVIFVRMGIPNDRYGPNIYKVEPVEGEQDPDAARVATLTDSNGGFRFRVRAPATVMLFVDAPGYVRTPMRFGRGQTEYVLKPGESRADVVLAIDAEAGLYGRVIDIDTRQGVAKLVVTPYKYENLAGNRMFTFAGQGVTTDGEGRFELKGLAPGEYYLQVRPELQAAFRTPSPDEPFKDVEKRGYTRTYYPDATRPEEASPITVLPAAKMEGLDIRIAKRRVAAIRGRIVGGEDLAGKDQLDLMLTEHRHGRDSRSYQRIAAGKVDAGALYQLDNVPAGSYALSVMTPDRTREERQRAVAYFEADDRNIDGLDLHLQKGFTVTGRVRLAPAEGETQEEQKPFETEMRIGISSTKSAGYATDGPIFVNRQDGSFAVPGVFPEELGVFLSGMPKGHKIAEVRYNGSPGDWTVIEVKPGEERHVLDIVLRPAGLSVQVRVTDGSKVVEGAMVAVVREPVTEVSLIRTAQPGTTDSEGKASFTNLLAGKYRVAAFAKDAMWRDDPGLPSTMSNAQQVVLGANASATVEVRVRDR